MAIERHPSRAHLPADGEDPLAAEARSRRPPRWEWAFANSLPMRAVKQTIDRVAGTDATVLILGESGVGKELVARTLHAQSPRHDRPFVKVNCAALPSELLESEMFGYERGAFTGAHRQKPGKFELANGGTIFLDEIGEMPLPLQAKLHHVLQDREFSRLGSRRDIRVDVRIVAATNKDLARLVDLGTFREDLYYRLNVVSVHVPPLRERREEIPLLVERFLDQYARQYGRPRPRLSPQTVRLFMEYDWPGNIRELENIVKRVVVLGSEDWIAHEMSIGPRHPRAVGPAGAGALAPAPVAAAPWVEGETLRAIVERAARSAERAALLEVLGRVRWNRREAARLLRISYKTLRRKIKEHRLED
jgi:two-component system response regulator AtoC